jgi:hypothetical protein
MGSIPSRRVAIVMQLDLPGADEPGVDGATLSGVERPGNGRELCP